MPDQSSTEPPAPVGRSEYIVFGDESGDHGLSNVRSHSRAFAIALAIFRRDDYEEYFVPALRAFKRTYFGDENLILHEREIRRGDGAFRRLKGIEEREATAAALRLFVAAAPFRIAAFGYRKDRYQPSEVDRAEPYAVPMIAALLSQQIAMPHTRGLDPATELVLDSRGAVEDAQLASVIERATFLSGPPYGDFRFDVRFARKSERVAGVELADLIANPIARRVLNEDHPLIPFEILEPKFLRHPDDPSRLALILANG